jgi:hypothetical protein
LALGIWRLWILGNNLVQLVWDESSQAFESLALGTGDHSSWDHIIMVLLMN